MGRYLFILIVTLSSLKSYSWIPNDTIEPPKDPTLKFNIGFEYAYMGSRLTDLDNIRPRNDFLNFGLTTTIKIKHSLSIETKVSLIKYGVIREEPGQEIFLENFYLNKQVIRSVQIPVLLNIDRFWYNPSNEFYNHGYFQVGFYYNFLIDATLKYKGDIYWEEWQPLPSYTRTKIRNTEYYRNDFGVATGLGFDFKQARRGPGIGLGIMVGTSLRPITNPDYTSDQHRIIFMQIYLRILFINIIK